MTKECLGFNKACRPPVSVPIVAPSVGTLPRCNAPIPSLTTKSIAISLLTALMQYRSFNAPEIVFRHADHSLYRRCYAIVFSGLASFGMTLTIRNGSG